MGHRFRPRHQPGYTGAYLAQLFHPVPEVRLIAVLVSTVISTVGRTADIVADSSYEGSLQLQYSSGTFWHAAVLMGLPHVIQQNTN